MADTQTIDQVVKEFQALAKRYEQGSREFSRKAKSTAELASEFNEATGRYKESLRPFLPAIEAKSPDGKKIEVAARLAKQAFAQFIDAKTKWAEGYSKEWEQHAGAARKFLAEAEKSRNGGVLIDRARRELAELSGMVDILEGFNGGDHPSVATERERLDALSSELERAEERFELNATMQKEVAAPVEKYSGSNRDELREKIAAEWRAVYPEDDLIAVVLHSDTWRVTARAKWDRADKSWEFAETRVLPARVIVRSDDVNAKIYMAYVNNRVHDGAINIGVKTKGSEYVVDTIALEKVAKLGGLLGNQGAGGEAGRN